MEKTLYELLYEYLRQERLSFEGDSGVADLNKVAEALGYRGHGFRYGSPLESFLSDNPGAQDALIEWIGDQNLESWKDSIESELPEDEEEEEEETEEGE